MKLVFDSWQEGEFTIFEYFINKLFSFLFKVFPVSNQIIFHFESRILSNYISNRSQVNSLVRLEASKPIIL